MPGLFIPRCRSVHTFGMRFAHDIHFLDRDNEIVASRLSVPARRIVREPKAESVLELPREGC